MKDFLKERGEMLVLSVFSPSYMTPRDFANQRGDRNEAEPRGFLASSGHRGCICCSLDLSSSCTVKFHLSIHPLRFFFFLFASWCFSSWFLQLLTVSVSTNLPASTFSPFLSHKAPFCRLSYSSFSQISNLLRSVSQVSLLELCRRFLKCIQQNPTRREEKLKGGD